ncbi:MAG: hypothetical protein N3D10_00870 [Candidatus Micrarchaeota archaeon]|nr:hypothetical protein [Candidatus Micrarchaeota archaeon]
MKNLYQNYYKTAQEVLNFSEYELKELEYNLEVVVYILVSFFAPFLLGHPQLLVGSIINCVLVLSAFNLKGKILLGPILLPSIAALAAGLIFGNFTVFLVYFVPFIWIANAIFVFLIKYFVFYKKLNKIFAIVLSALVKAFWLFLISFLLYFFGYVPEAFLAIMGIVQLQTAIIGGAFGLVLQNIKRRILD